MTDFPIIITAIIALLTALGGGVAWVAARMSSQASRFDRMEDRYNSLHRDHTLVLVKVERFRLALQIAVATIARNNPKDEALTHIQALLADQFIFPSEVQTKTPADMERALKEMDKQS